MKHEMGLQNKWFDAIDSGRKKFELRLFDAKRQQIRIGDTIEFTAKDGRKLTKQVYSLSIYPTFRQLFMAMPHRITLMLPGAKDYEEMLAVMEEFYPVEKQEINGVVAIGLR